MTLLSSHLTEQIAESIEASKRTPQRLVQGVDEGGLRFYLDGRPLRCGHRLELRLPGDRWTEARFEMEGRRPILMMSVGHVFEKRFQVRRKNEVTPDIATGSGDATLFPAIPPEHFVIIDTRNLALVRCGDQAPADRDGYIGRRWPELEQDHWSHRPDALREATYMNAVYEGCEEVVVSPVDLCELRFPESG